MWWSRPGTAGCWCWPAMACSGRSRRSEQVEHTRDDRPFEPYSRDEMSKRLLAELPQGFRVRSTAHYLIFFDTSPAYAQWCGALFERLYMAFTNFWTHKGFDLSQPEFPLVAVVFADKQSYLNFSRPELGDAGESIIGYFGLTSQPDDDVRSDGRRVARARCRPGQDDGPDQPDSGPAGRLADRCHDRPRGDASDRVQLRAAHAAERLPAVVQRGDRDVFRDARPPQRQGLERHWGGELAAVGAIPAVSRRRPADSLETLDPRRRAIPRFETGAGRLRRSLGADVLPLHQHPKDYVAYLAMLSKKKPLLEDGPENGSTSFAAFSANSSRWMRSSCGTWPGSVRLGTSCAVPAAGLAAISPPYNVAFGKMLAGR